MYAVLTLLFFIFFMRFFVLDLGVVQGFSMEPSLQTGQRFAVNKPVYLIHPPRRFDIVQVVHPSERDKLLVKRVVGLPEETLVARWDKLYIRDAAGQETLLPEPHVEAGRMITVKGQVVVEIKIPEDSYAVMGDNRGDSIDSRHFGVVHRKLIVGKVMTL